jgi:hypothetical protein
MVSLVRIVFLFLCVSAQSVLAQQQYLVQLKPNASVASVKEQLTVKASWTEIDAAFRIYAITIDSSYHFSKQSFLSNNNFACAQPVNTVVNRGVFPNDPQFVKQKHLTRMYAPEIWPFLNSGLNRKGDTLVIAIVDSGMDTLHVDLDANRWYNRKEIPANGIDDDANGYKDDYYGWNGGDSNNRTYTSVTLDGHGQAIAGIVGASGNNGIGVAGVNWNIKVMPVLCYAEQGLGSDIGVVRSLIYVLRMKQLYLNTAGAKGANIVALNTSIGIDNAFPIDAPIWCALYDSLGKVGIVSSIAASNNDVNIDTKGDIPSLCPSNYTIVVNASTELDGKMSSGYSSTSVDIAAQGEKVYSTALSRNSGSDGPYKYVNGTSFAAPQVAGTLAALNQWACDTFLALQMNQPDSAARLMKSWLLQGHDVLPAFAGKNATNGRINAAKAFNAMDQWCRQRDAKYAGLLEPKSGPVDFLNPIAAGQDLSIGFGSELPSMIYVMDMAGRTLEVPSRWESNSCVLETQQLSTGNYLLVFSYTDFQVVRKLQVN